MSRLSRVALAALALLACGAGGFRPSFQPFPNSPTTELSASPDAVIQAVAGEIQNEQGLQVQWVSPGEGYLETQWYNIQSRESGGIDTQALDRVVRFRFWADPAGQGKTKLTAEAVWLRGYDPSLPIRDQESPVPSAHYGARLVSRILEALGARFST